MAGHRWLTWVCEQTNEDPIQVFRETVKANFYGALKPRAYAFPRSQKQVLILQVQ